MGLPGLETLKGHQPDAEVAEERGAGDGAGGAKGVRDGWPDGGVITAAGLILGGRGEGIDGVWRIPALMGLDEQGEVVGVNHGLPKLIEGLAHVAVFSAAH